MSFFSTKLPLAILLKKMTIFIKFFEKNVKFLAIFWHSNGNFPEGQHWICSLTLLLFVHPQVGQWYRDVWTAPWTSTGAGKTTGKVSAPWKESSGLDWTTFTSSLHKVHLFCSHYSILSITDKNIIYVLPTFSSLSVCLSFRSILTFL